VAGVVGIAFFLGAVWLVATGGSLGTPRPSRTPSRSEPPIPSGAPARTPPGDAVSERVGFVGLPPVGATRSKPRTGELVLEYQGRRFATWYQVFVYADGRMIWQREGNLAEGANGSSTGFLEQRLTRTGIRMLRSRGSAGAALFGFPWRPPYPASWLPPRAWEDRTIRAYVPSRYAVCYDVLWRAIPPSRIVAWLPVVAERLLRAGVADVRFAGGWLRGFDGTCSVLTTAGARTVALALHHAGLRQDVFQQAYGLTYSFESRGVRNQAVLRFEPILPHDEVACTGCG
jgi:hypothetical protein